MSDPEPIRQRLQALAHVRELARNEYLFQQGEPVTSVFEVLSGQVRLLRRTIDDHLVVLDAARDGEIFAESTLFSEVYHCDAMAAAPARVRSYPKPAFLAALRATPESWEHIAARLAHHLQDLRTQMEVRHIRSARERLLQYLQLQLSGPQAVVHLEGELQDLASQLGLSREALYRTLATLEREGAIARFEHGMVVKKPLSV